MVIDIQTVHHGIQKMNTDNVIMASLKEPSVIFNCVDNKVIEFGLRQTTELGSVFVLMNDELMERLLVSLGSWK